MGLSKSILGSYGRIYFKWECQNRYQGRMMGSMSNGHVKINTRVERWDPFQMAMTKSILGSNGVIHFRLECQNPYQGRTVGSILDGNVKIHTRIERWNPFQMGMSKSSTGQKCGKQFQDLSKRQQVTSFKFRKSI